MMQVFTMVFAIALSTALLAAAIVALNLDIAIISAWRALFGSEPFAGRSTDWSAARRPGWETNDWMPMQAPADERPTFQSSEMTFAAPAVPLRDVLQERRAQTHASRLTATPLRDVLARRQAEQSIEDSKVA